MKSEVDYPKLIREIRTARGLTQQQLADELSATFQSVNGWENGKHRPIRAFSQRLLHMATEIRGAQPAPSLKAVRKYESDAVD